MSEYIAGCSIEEGDAVYLVSAVFLRDVQNLVDTRWVPALLQKRIDAVARHLSPKEAQDG